MRIAEFLEFINFMEALKDNTRHSWTSKGRRESVAEHSWRLAVMAMLLKDEFPELDHEKLLKMCILHDWGEAVTGDIPAFEKRRSDEQTEQSAMEQLLRRLPESYREDFLSLYNEYETRSTEEARVCKALDKLEALIQHNQADISSWLELEYGLNMTYGNKETEFSVYLKSLRDRVRQDTRDKIRAEAPERQTEGGMEIRELHEGEVYSGILNGFDRRQEVKKRWRCVNGEWKIESCDFVDDWNDEERQDREEKLRRIIAEGGNVIGAFEDGVMIGFVCLRGYIWGKTARYVRLEQIHVSNGCRGKGIGKKLFAAACDRARARGGEKLYISAHSAVETQGFYRARGCDHAQEIDREHAEAEPFDIQMEYIL